MLNIHSSRKTFGFLIIILGLAFIAFIVYFFFFYNYSKTPAEQGEEIVLQTGEELPKQSKEPIAGGVETPQISAQELAQDDVRQIAVSFTERLGTFSNQTDSSQLEDLKLFMTETMKEWAVQTIKENRQTDYTKYYGITTKAVSAEVLKYENDKAEVLVHTQRTENKDGKPRTYNQDMLIKLVKPNKVWRVDFASWQ